MRALLRRRNAGAPVEARSSPAIVAPTSSASAPLVASRAAASQAETTRAIVVERYGGPEELQLRDIALPPPAPDEVRIRHTVIGVNFIDVYCRTGFFDLLQPPGVPGMEAAGVIEAVGLAVSGFSIGDRVAYACPPVGAYSERRNMAPELLVRLSDDISDETAAAGLLKGVAASFLLHDVHAVKTGTSCSSMPRQAASASCWCSGRAISARPSSPPSRATTRRASSSGSAPTM
ncbi:alcohol dehydrogenase catalytic domain-containing protein [Mesorhizobium sp. M8A.F.Ca.ET.057.01.1.1]|uniref:alcohol dehydrogenase catalytic domain-containing protein n=1 Tax=Mesorhizobium sp. M8A.F.Ca.ET.057.01.1.1 TaxID=2493679 RepID=UPI001FDEA67E|nr:alcohol dehydrogenase catalytic domain-containing protein [Mesorhizobium sp. M8A.F.Ca.ET.057.01.1.1]